MNEAILILNEEYFFSYSRLEQKRKKKKKDVLSSLSLTLVFQRTTEFYKNYFLTQKTEN